MGVQIIDGHTTAEWRDRVTVLFVEYAASLAVDLCFDGFDNELMTLETMYGPPEGCLLLALDAMRSAGCVGLRRLEPEICEMKRLYVPPAFRGLGVGRQLACTIIERGRAMGYRRMRLDTLLSMSRARALYRSLGFRPIPPYRHNYFAGTSFLELDLTAPE